MLPICPDFAFILADAEQSLPPDERRGHSFSRFRTIPPLGRPGRPWLDPTRVRAVPIARDGSEIA